MTVRSRLVKKRYGDGTADAATAASAGSLTSAVGDAARAASAPGRHGNGPGDICLGLFLVRKQK